MQFEIFQRNQLTLEQEDEMFILLARHFDGVTRDQFAQDLREKTCVLLLSRAGRLVGFSTLLAYTTQFENQTLNVIYSGDTIVTPEAWSSMMLPRAWVTAVEELRAALPPLPCFWLLLTSGFRTYRFLPVFWREFFPRFDRHTPADQQHLLNHIARDQFGSQFDEHAGLVRFRHPQKLRAGLNQVPETRTTNPHVVFFLARNPKHAEGDELVCLTELCPENLTAAGQRMATAVAVCDNAG